MNPLSCDDGAFITISEPLQLQNGSSDAVIMNPLMMKVMNPLSRGYPRRYDRQPLDQGLRRPPKISQISSSDEAFDEGFDEPRSSS
jgi:hypothetical protein